MQTQSHQQIKPDRVESDNSRSNVVDELRETAIRRDNPVGDFIIKFKRNKEVSKNARAR
jgi:hypothetical protein